MSDSTKKINFQINSWRYVGIQNQETGELSFEIAPEKVGVVEKIGSYLSAEASRFTGTISLEQIQARRNSCLACETKEVKGEDEWYCRGCGCPDWTRSQLQNKWTMPAARCPLGKWDKASRTTKEPKPVVRHEPNVPR